MAEALVPGYRLEAAQRRRQRSEAWAAWALAGPATFLLFLLLLGPTAAVILLSATDWQLGAKTMRFVGLGNYAELFADRVFRQSLANTLLYVAITVPASVGLGPGAAMLPRTPQNRIFRLMAALLGKSSCERRAAGFSREK